MKLLIFLGVCCTLWWSVFYRADGAAATLVMLDDAPNQGAMCLDGSSPGFYYRQGMGTGAKKLIIFLEGGGFCYTEELCGRRSRSRLGSSRQWPQAKNFSGLLSDNKTDNPDFYNWHVVFVPYCDGAFFAGNLENTVNWNGTTLHFRGFKILQATLNFLLDNGMKNATDVILSGCSAGGLATYLHADYVKKILPTGVKFAAIADAGFFIDEPNVNGTDIIGPQINATYALHNLSAGVNQACLKAYAPQNEGYNCLGAQATEPYITSDLFGINSKYDTWQLANIVQIHCNPPRCSQNMIKAAEKFSQEWVSASSDFANRKGRGVFFDSCFHHCQSLGSLWNSVRVDGQSIRETVGNWYFGRSGKTKALDCDYPCNKSC